MIAYSVVLLSKGHAAQPKGNEMLVAFFHAPLAHASTCNFCAITDVFCLLRDAHSYGIA
jgi:hypothetical protein